jgi:hypothetical protein
MAPCAKGVCDCRDFKAFIGWRWLAVWVAGGIFAIAIVSAALGS